MKKDTPTFEKIFRTSNELLSFVQNIRKKGLPRRSEGRTTEQVESIILADFINYRIESPFWSYPITITHHDRPDFILSFEDKSVGIEITEQKTKHYGQALCFAEKKNGFYDPSFFRFDRESKLKGKKTGKKVAELVNRPTLTGPPSMGNDEENNWIKRTVNTILEKNEKAINYPNINNFYDNILLIFDVTPETVIYDQFTDNMFTPLYDLHGAIIFDRVYCIDSRVINIDMKKRAFSISRNY